MRRLLASALLGFALPAAAADCPSDAAQKVGADASNVLPPCIAEMTKIRMELTRLSDPKSPGTPQERAQAAERYDALLANMTGVFAAIRALPLEVRQSCGYLCGATFQGVLTDLASPRYRGYRDSLMVQGIEPAKPDLPTSVPQPAPKLQDPPAKVEPTQQGRDAALDQAAAGETKLAQSPAPNPVLASRVAEDYLRGADPAGAERVLTPLIEQGEGGAQPIRLRGTARYQKGDWSGAYEDAQRALESNPEDRYAQDLAGAARMMLNRLGLKAPRLKPPERSDEDAGAGPVGPEGGGSRVSRTEAPPGPADLGRWMTDIKRKVRIGDRQGALLDLTRLLGRDPRHLRALAQRAYLLNHGPKPDPEAALLDADRALKISPDDPEALRERAYALVQLGKAAEALPLLETAIGLEPANALGYLYRAKAYEALARREEALADYKRAAALDPALRSFYEEALAGPTKAAPRDWPRPTAAQARGLVFVLGAGLVLWGLWRAARFVAGWTGRLRSRRAPAAAPADDTLAPGTVLGGVYRVGGVLGRGGMGVVYEAVDLGLERPVAVKQLRTPDATADDAERFLREARLVAKLSHPRIVQIHALVEEEGRLYMVFERVAGRTLAEELAERGRLAPAEVLAVVRDVCEALAAAHGARVIHRDLKPGNVMRGPDGRCKVMDFGIARQSVGDGHTLTEAWGTPPYMAPEQESGRVGVESDLYALACMSLELLTGARPFAGTSDKLALRFRRPSESGLPGGFDAFMEKALDPRPERRYRSAAAFREAFEGCLTDRAAT